jgi:hypothetical protein
VILEPEDAELAKRLALEKARDVQDLRGNAVWRWLFPKLREVQIQRLRHAKPDAVAEILQIKARLDSLDDIEALLKTIFDAGISAQEERPPVQMDVRPRKRVQ